MKLLAEDICESNAAEWDLFLAEQSYHNAFQSARMLLALENNRCYRPCGRLFRDSPSSDIIGGYVFHVVREIPGLASLLATRVIINGGPIVRPGYEEYLGQIVDDIVSHPGLQGTYLDIWHGTDWAKHSDLLHNKGFSFSDHLNYIVDLNQDPKIIWGSISKRKRRYIKRNNARLKIRQVQSLQGLTALCSLLQETYRRIKLPLIDFSVFEDVHKAGIGLFIVAENDGQMVASRAVLDFGKSLYDWHAGSSVEHRSLHANESMVWWVLSYGIQHGYSCFDFGGAGKPDKPYGPRRFKAQFGGTLVNYGRHKLVLSPIRNAILDQIIGIREQALTLIGKRSPQRNNSGGVN